MNILLFKEVRRMNKAQELRFYLEALCVYDLKKDGVIASLLDLLQNINSEKVLEKQSEFFRQVTSHRSFAEYVSRLILTDDNAFTKAAASGKVSELPEAVINGVKSDLEKLEAIAFIRPEAIYTSVESDDLREVLKTLPAWETGEAASPLNRNWKNQIDELITYHQKNGYGMYSKYTAFIWRDHALCPIAGTDPILLTDLKNYETQRQKVIDNTESFVNGYPSNNVLLYGDRGTGKSSTVHAILNEYAKHGLRMIEISKDDITDLNLIREQLAQCPMKFIIFIDDLCFDSHDDSFGKLKAALEGSLSGRKPNTIIYATSNRRHLIKESFSDRENDINRNDIMQEQLSLSDRFGLCITFINPDKKGYLDIVDKIAADRSLDVDKDKLHLVAEQWASRKGGRSPRCARQFIDYVESAQMRGKEW